MAFIGKITAPLKRAVMKSTRKNKSDNAVITNAFKESDFKSRPKFIEAVKKQVEGTEKKAIPLKKGTFKPKKPNPKTEKDKGRVSRKNQKEFNRLKKEQEDDIKASRQGTMGSRGGPSAGGMQQKTIKKPGSSRGKRKVADPQNKLRGSERASPKELANFTYDEVQEYINKGLGGDARTNMDVMRGRAMTKAQREEIEGMVKGGDLSIQRKYGGKVKRNMGGPVRGVGKAMRGFGNANYSKKMY